jgi:hypothetical protein
MAPPKQSKRKHPKTCQGLYQTLTAILPTLGTQIKEPTSIAAYRLFFLSSDKTYTRQKLIVVLLFYKFRSRNVYTIVQRDVVSTSRQGILHFRT